MKKNILTIISALFVGAVIFVYFSNRPSTDESQENDRVAMENLGVPADGTSGSIGTAPTEVFPGEPSHEAHGFLPTETEDPQAYEKYQATFNEMAVCLNMQINAFRPDQQMSYETFHNIINPDLGDVVTTSTEWTSTDIRTPAGEIRRIYIEYGPDVDGPPTRTLKYYSIGRDGAQTEIPLSNDQTYSPTDTLIASLEADGQTVGISSSRKMFYQNGDDLVLVEKDGKVLSFELPHDGATYSCNNFDNPARMSCRCQ